MVSISLTSEKKKNLILSSRSKIMSLFLSKTHRTDLFFLFGQFQLTWLWQFGKEIKL